MVCIKGNGSAGANKNNTLNDRNGNVNPQDDTNSKKMFRN